MSVPPAPRRRRSRRRLAVVGVVGVLAIGVVVGLVWFFGGDEPEQVDAERALQQEQRQEELAEEPETGEQPAETEDPAEAEDPAETEDPAEEPSAEERAGSDAGDMAGGDVGELGEEPQEVGPPEDPQDLDGRWVVDRSREFNREEGQGTFGGYRIEEELAGGIGNSVAVGRSPEVSGWVIFDEATVISAYAEVDLTQLVSDDDRRDNRVREELGAGASATFELEEEILLPEVPPVGEVIQLTANGTLTIRGVANEVEVQLQAAVTETGLIVAGSTDILLSDYDVDVPSATIVLSVSDEATLEWQLFLDRA